MLLGYNTNGLAHHDPLEAISLLADIGYRSVAITLDHGRLNPFAAGFDRELEKVRQLLQRRGMRSVIETGARFLLDPRVKHEPTLITADSATFAADAAEANAADAAGVVTTNAAGIAAVESGRRRRLDFYRRSVLAAKALGSDCVSIWSGVLHGHDAGDPRVRSMAFERLRAGLVELLDFAEEQGMTIGFEPEPGMLIDTQARWVELRAAINHPRLRLTLDVGHLHCQGETPLAEQIRRCGDALVNVHLEDMRAGVHEHLMFGEGEINFPPVLAALAARGYRGGVHVELSRHSHDGPRAAQRAYDFLAPLWESATGSKH